MFDNLRYEHFSAKVHNIVEKIASDVGEKNFDMSVTYDCGEVHAKVYTPKCNLKYAYFIDKKGHIVKTIVGWDEKS